MVQNPLEVLVNAPSGPPPLVIIAAIIVGGIILYPLMVAFGRMLEGRSRGESLPADSSARLQRLEQAVEAMAVEVERISEGQRYTTKLLTERLPLAVRIPDAKNAEKTLL